MKSFSQGMMEGLHSVLSRDFSVKILSRDVLKPWACKDFV
jgi:hypothetical protein